MNISTAGATTKLFLSYSRKDRGLVGQLYDALEADKELTVFRDTEDILPTEEWKPRLESLIRASDTIIFALSPNSVASEICQWELELAESLNKRIIPVVVEDVVGVVPSVVSKLNYVFLTGADSFQRVLPKIQNAISLDIDWIREHTRLGEMAQRWELTTRLGAQPLRGKELEAAESWLAVQPKDAPSPTQAHREYILRSRKAATKRQRTSLFLSMSALLVVGALGSFSWVQRNAAIKNERKALDRQYESLVAFSDLALDQNKVRSSLLAAVEAHGLDVARSDKSGALAGISAALTEPYDFAAHTFESRSNLARGVTGLSYDNESNVLSIGLSDGGAYNWHPRQSVAPKMILEPEDGVYSLGATVATNKEGGVAVAIGNQVNLYDSKGGFVSKTVLGVPGVLAGGPEGVHWVERGNTFLKKPPVYYPLDLHSVRLTDRFIGNELLNIQQMTVGSAHAFSEIGDFVRFPLKNQRGPVIEGYFERPAGEVVTYVADKGYTFQIRFTKVISDISISNNGIIAIGFADGSISIFDSVLVEVPNQKERTLRTLFDIERRHLAPITKVLFTHGGQQLWTADEDGLVVGWQIDHLLPKVFDDTEHGKTDWPAPQSEPQNEATILPKVAFTGRRMDVSHPSRATWSVTFELLEKSPSLSQQFRHYITDDGAFLFVQSRYTFADSLRRNYVFDLEAIEETGEVSFEGIDEHNDVNFVAGIRPKGVTGDLLIFDTGRIQQMHPETGEPKTVLELEPITAAQIIPSADNFVVLHQSGRISVIDVQTLLPLADLVAFGLRTRPNVLQVERSDAVYAGARENDGSVKDHNIWDLKNVAFGTIVQHACDRISDQTFPPCINIEHNIGDQ